MLHSFFRVIPRRLNFMCRRFGILCSIFTGRLKNLWKETKCSETSVDNYDAGESPERKNTTNSILFTKILYVCSVILPLSCPLSIWPFKFTIQQNLSLQTNYNFHSEYFNTTETLLSLMMSHSPALLPDVATINRTLFLLIIPSRT
jgi:hypothetical protein